MVQKGAVSLPVYAPGDIAGSFTGRLAEVDDNFELVQAWPCDITINADGTYSGVDGGYGPLSEGSAPIGLDSSNFGRYLDTYSQPSRLHTTGDFTALLSPDRQFLAVYTCPLGYNAIRPTPEVCTFHTFVRDP